LKQKLERKKTILDLHKFLNFKRGEVKKVSSAKKKADKSTVSKKRILLVDDDKDTQYAMQYILEEAGYEVFIASDGREAVKRLETDKLHLILMDIMMPGMDGYEATRILKENERFKHIPIVAMTAKAMKGDRRKTILVGCDDYIAKPFEPQAILDIVNKWIKEGKVNERT